MATNYFSYTPPIDYDLITGTSTLVVSLADAKTYLRIDSSNTSEDTLITNLIYSATTYFELVTGRDLINKTYACYPDNFPNSGNGYYALVYNPYWPPNSPIKLKKSRVQSITSIQYYRDGVLTTFSSANYYVTKEADNFPSIYLVNDANWPNDVDNRAQAVVITFVAGYGASSDNVPYDIKQCILQMVDYLYENRGDCGGDCSKLSPALQSMVLKRKIIDL